MSIKRQRPVPRLPAGFEDAPAGVVRARRAMIATIGEVYERFGFEPLETPALEYADCLGKFLPEADQPTGGVFAFRDSDGLEQWLTLRYDLTAPLARFYAEHEKEESFTRPYRRWQTGPVWRDERPGPGRFRQFIQCDFDTVGAASLAADAEVCMVLAEAFDALGIPRKDYEIRVNDRKVLNGVLEQAGVATEAARLTTLRALDKLDRLGMDGVRHLLGRGREDETGHFTPGAQLSPDQQAIIVAFVEAQASTRAGICGAFRDLVGGSREGLEGVAELETIAELLDASGLEEARVKFDPSLVRGLAYYTGPVFEAALTFNVLDETGHRRSFGSVAGGGRYDDLVMRFTGQRVPATGASIGVDRLLAALRLLDRVKVDERPGPVVVTVMDRGRLPAYQVMVNELRAAGIVAELYLGNPKKFGKQLEYADARRSPAVVIAGGDEFDRGEVSIKDLRLGAELAARLKDEADAEAYQQQVQGEAQRSVARVDLVAEVRRILGH
ncbi:MAG: histidine--tRNA ligase [Myxococcales bacterium]|nr:histidine--tRNA ligase [Myxococcales bacterium]